MRENMHECRENERLQCSNSNKIGTKYLNEEMSSPATVATPLCLAQSIILQYG
jgi:hypothetical protein